MFTSVWFETVLMFDYLCMMQECKRKGAALRVSTFHTLEMHLWVPNTAWGLGRGKYVSPHGSCETEDPGDLKWNDEIWWECPWGNIALLWFLISRSFKFLAWFAVIAAKSGDMKVSQNERPKICDFLLKSTIFQTIVGPSYWWHFEKHHQWSMQDHATRSWPPAACNLI